MARTEQVRTDLVTTGAAKAAGEIDKVADAAERLEKLDPEVEVTADTSQAARAVEALDDDAAALARRDTELILKARADAARAELKQLDDQLQTTARQADDTNQHLDRVTGGGGGGLRGNAIADLTGPLGEASTAASDFAGVFDGIGDAAEAAAGKIGLSQTATAALSTVVGGLGVAVAAGAAAWSYFQERQKKAREEQAKVIDGQRKLNDAIREGDRLAAATSFTKLYADQETAARKAGIATEDWVNFVKGASDELPGFEANMKAATDAAANHTVTVAGTAAEVDRTTRQWLALRDTLEDGRAKYAETNGVIKDQDRNLDQVADALVGAKRETDNLRSAQDKLKGESQNLVTELDKIRGALDIEQASLNFQSAMAEAMDVSDDVGPTQDQILAVKNSILDLGTTAGTNPAVIKSQIDMVDSKDLYEVLWNVNAYYAKNPAQIKTELIPPTNRTFSGQGGTAMPAMAATGGGVAVVNVTQHVPRGYRGDVLADARAAARRSGGLYQRSRR